MSLYLCDIERIWTFDDSELKIYLCSPANLVYVWVILLDV